MSIKNGIMVFDGDDPMALPNGTAVRIEAETFEQRFQRLKAEWNADTKYLSDPNKIMAHPAMRAIVALGRDVAPIILRELQADASLLVWALPEITGENPAPSILENGIRIWDVRAQNQAWLQWGKERKLI
jgi:hypothetical protein